jgi:hypothetical protein
MAKEVTSEAKKIYATMVKALRDKNWKFEEKEEELTIISIYQGEDIPMAFKINVDSDREVIRFISPMPFHIDEDKRVDAALAVSVANYGLVNGSFDYDLNDGEIRFRLTTSYVDCEVGPKFFFDMMATALSTTDEYNDKFLMLSKGMLTLQQFIEQDGE